MLEIPMKTFGFTLGEQAMSSTMNAHAPSAPSYGRSRRRTPGHLGPRASAKLSHAAGTPRRWLPARRYRTIRSHVSLTPWLSERLGQPFIIENRPGAGNNIATEAVVRAPADGHTLLVADASKRHQRDAL